MTAHPRLQNTTRPVAAVTGASSGLGAEFARQLAANFDLLLIARREPRLRELADELSSRFPVHVDVLPRDLSIDSDLASVADRLTAESRLELLVNCAGFGAEGLFWQIEPELHGRMNRLHIQATARLTHAALRNLVPRNTGAVINVASVSAWMRRPTFIGYAATKSWTVAFTEGLLLDLHQAGSCTFVQALCPGLMYTEFHDKMGVGRGRFKNEKLWQQPSFVVAASLDGWKHRTPIVLPGWRYRTLVALLSVLPRSLNLSVQRLLMPG